MGWCMTEFDDTQGGGGDHVLCRVRRSSSSLAKRKFKSSPPSSLSKRKAAGDHHEAPPAKLIHPEAPQQDPAAFVFTNAYPTWTMPCYGFGAPEDVGPVTMVGGVDYGVQQPRVEAEYGGEFNLEELLNMDQQVQQDSATFTNAYPAMPACYGHRDPQGVDYAMFGDVEPEHGGDLGEFSFQDLLKLKTDEWKDFEDFLLS